jgi:hypothetical protein
VTAQYAQRLGNVLVQSLSSGGASGPFIL